MVSLQLLNKGRTSSSAGSTLARLNLLPDKICVVKAALAQEQEANSEE